MRSRIFISSLLAALALAPAAFAQDDGPRIDIIEVAGVIDAPIARYVRERIVEAEERSLDLLVFQIDSPGILKASQTSEIPDLVTAIRDSSVPIAIHVGPRGARVGGGAVAMLEAAHISAMSPTAVIDITDSFDLATGDPINDSELELIARLAQLRGRTLTGAVEAREMAAGEARNFGLVDDITPGLPELLLAAHGRTLRVAGGEVTLDIPEDLVSIRFWQPGPVRRALHAMSNPYLGYLALIGAIMLLVFEASQPGFGVAGGTAVFLGIAAAYSFTVLPASWWAMAMLLGGSLLLWLDVIRDELLVPTFVGLGLFAAGSIFLLPSESSGTALPVWMAIASSAVAFIFFAPIMTLVKRSRQPISTVVKRALIGETGDVRSMLNPEGYVMVSGELWRARLTQGGRLRVGETVTVTGVDGALLLVAGPSEDPAP